MKNFKSILFVCLGNICRSPLAEGIAKKIANDKGLEITVDSAGTSGYHSGEAPCTNSQVIAKQYGIDISKQRSREVDISDFHAFDMIIALDNSNLKDLEMLGCQNCTKLGNFGANGKDVPDPYYYDGLEGFEKVFKMIENCVENIFDRYQSAKNI